VKSVANLRLLYHGHCFDGVASAATFTRFYKERIHPDAEVRYTGLLHRPGNLFDMAMFDSDENAIVDFKYAASEKLTWWFDHHESAFLTPEDEAHFHADKSGRKFLDATRKSCTEFIADVTQERFGFNPEPIKSLVHWAHIIDGALYESPAQCVELREPALQLMQVIEADPDDSFIERIIRELTTQSLEEVATSAEVQRRFEPILKQHLETLEVVLQQAGRSDPNSLTGLGELKRELARFRAGEKLDLLTQAIEVQRSTQSEEPRENQDAGIQQP